VSDEISPIHEIIPFVQSLSKGAARQGGSV
jgi:hypothetical protein